MTEHAALSWETDRPLDQEWTDTAFELQRAGKLRARVTSTRGVLTFHLHGPCPRCHATLTEVRPLTGVVEGVGVLGDRAEVPAAKDTFVPVDTRCSCTLTHDKRPAGRHGCGIGFRVLAVREGSQ